MMGKNIILVMWVALRGTLVTYRGLESPAAPAVLVVPTHVEGMGITHDPDSDQVEVLDEVAMTMVAVL